MSMENRPQAEEEVSSIFRNEGIIAGGLALPADTSSGLISPRIQLPASLLNLMMRSSDFVYLVDADARFIAVNNAVCRFLGYTLQEMQGMKVPDIDVTYDYLSWQKTFKKLRKVGSFRWGRWQQGWCMR